MQIEIVSPDRSKVFQSAGRCIYCGSNQARTREHVMPKGLGGCIVFLDASCESCRTITSQVERDTLAKDYKIFRAHVGFPMNEKVVPKDAYWLVLPILPRPGILVGRAPSADSLITHVQRLSFHPSESVEIPISDDIPSPKFCLGSFIRMIAKIAHGYAVGMLGIDRFAHLLPNLILGKNPNLLHHLAGCADSVIDEEMRKQRPITRKIPDEPQSSWTTHQISLGVISPDGHRVLATVMLRLFAYYSVPLYEIVVGELRADDPLCARLRRSA
jgi:hypothetical protein